MCGDWGCHRDETEREVAAKGERGRKGGREGQGERGREGEVLGGPSQANKILLYLLILVCFLLL